MKNPLIVLLLLLSNSAFAIKAENSDVHAKCSVYVFGKVIDDITFEIVEQDVKLRAMATRDAIYGAEMNTPGGIISLRVYQEDTLSIRVIPTIFPSGTVAVSGKGTLNVTANTAANFGNAVSTGNYDSSRIEVSCAITKK